MENSHKSPKLDTKELELPETLFVRNIIKFTDLHVPNVHVVFKNMAPDHQLKKISEILEHTPPSLTIVGSESDDRHTS